LVDSPEGLEEHACKSGWLKDRPAAAQPRVFKNLLRLFIGVCFSER
jgi:hypothetical protein